MALVGPSGGGKTTLCHLIPRFYEIGGGKILLDGHDIRTLSLVSLRQAIGLVQQEVFIFAGTIFENICFGRPGANLEEVQEAARRADIHDFIMSCPEGYESLVGERGVLLSGGQKQRLAIARIFLKNPPILILDEATSSLDNEAERRVQRALNNLSQGRTSLVVAHRLSTIENADQILVLQETQIVERGTHAELLRLQGAYYRLHRAMKNHALVPEED